MIVLVDAGLTPSWVSYLQSSAVESVHWSSIGPGDAPDSALLGWAIENDAIILTADGDFTNMLAVRHLSGPSVIYLRTNERNPSGPGQTVVDACRKIIAQPSPTGFVVTIDERGQRIRSLPIEKTRP